MDIGPLDDLDEFSKGNMADLDEARVEDDDVGRVERNSLGCAFPFDDGYLAISEVAVPINV